MTVFSPLWIPRSKIIWSNWELISRFRCLLASWIPRFDFFKVIWEVQCCKCFKIHAQHSLWFLKRHKNGLSGNCFSLGCKYLVKQFPACCFILKNGNSWRKEQPISSKKSKSGSFFSWSGTSWIPGYPGKQKTHWNVEISKGFSLILVGMTGFEPAAFASRTQRSTKLSHIPLLQNHISFADLCIIAPLANNFKGIYLFF